MLAWNVLSDKVDESVNIDRMIEITKCLWTQNCKKYK